MKLLSQGAEGRLYVIKRDDKFVLVKERFVKNYRLRCLDKMITKKRFKVEIKALTKCSEIGIAVPKIFGVDKTENSIYIKYFENSVTLKNILLNSHIKNKVITNLLQKFGILIATLHESGIIHGDLTTSNFLVNDGKNLNENSNEEYNLIIIDFGLAKFVEGSQLNKNESSSLLEEKAVDLYVMEKAFLSTHFDLGHLITSLILPSYATYVNENRCQLQQQSNESAIYDTDSEDEEIGNFYKSISIYKDSTVYPIFNKLNEVRKRGRKKTMIG